jgi:tetratricopeptide (TPR) repeat protein
MPLALAGTNRLTRPTLARLVVPCVLLALGSLRIEAEPSQSTAAATPDSADATGGRGRAYAHLMRSLFLAREGDMRKAETEARAALEIEPREPELLLQVAEVFAAIGLGDEAEQLARKALDIDAEFRPALRFLANHAAQRAFATETDTDSRAEAVRLFERLAAAGDDDLHVLRMLIQLRLVGGDLDGAIEAARTMVARAPGDLAATRTLAQLLRQRGDLAGALEVALRYVSEHTDQVDLLEWTETMTYSLEAWDRAAAILGERAPYDRQPAMQRFYGEALLRVGRLAEATTVLEAAVAAEPSHDRTRYNLAKAYRSASRLADAEAILDDLVAESPNHPGYHWFLAETREARGDAEGALASYAAALETMPAGDERVGQRDALRRAIARLHLQQKAPERALEWLDRLEQPDDPENLESRARMAIDAGDWTTARQAVRRLLEKEALGIAAALDGEIAAHEGRWTKAAERFSEAIELLGPYARRRIADVYHDLGRPELGEELLREWSRESAELADARYLLGVYLYELDRLDEAEHELREAFRLDPEHAPALNYLGYSLAERNVRLDEALGLIQRAVALDSSNGAFLDSLGWVYFQMGRYDEARPALERAARELPRDPTILDHLGDLYLRIDEVDLALAAWNRALEAGPDDPETIRGKIARVRDDAADARYPPRSSAEPPEPGGDGPRAR